MQLVADLKQFSINDVEKVGGKNASLGEMITQLSKKGVRVPGGFATTAHAYRTFLEENNLTEKIDDLLKNIDVNDIDELVRVGKEIRNLIENAKFSVEFENKIRKNYQKLVKAYGDNSSYAIRSSATAEDLPDASFAGQQETFLNISGIDNVLKAVKKVFASLYNDRAISYRIHNNFKHSEVALSAGIQLMSRSDVGASGVMFTIDTESGFDDVVFITAAYGLGETVVQGSVNPDEFYVAKAIIKNNKPAIVNKNLGSKKIKMIYSDNKNSAVRTVDVDENERSKFCINNEQIEELAKFAVIIEQHYQKPMDIEWSLNGLDNKIYILQARPETVKSKDNQNVITNYKLKTHSNKVVITGRAIGQKIASGKAKIITDLKYMNDVNEGDILVTDMTDPDWEPIMKRAGAIVSNRGGRTCHAAIIARELGVPAVVGCGDATEVIRDGQDVTISCAEGDEGYVYDGIIDFDINKTNITRMPDLKTNIMLNIGNPSYAFNLQATPNEGVGLARLEFIINNMIGIHPKAIIEIKKQDKSLRNYIKSKAHGYKSPKDFYIQKLIEGISTLAVAFKGKKVIVRLSDFKSNEYANLIGGDIYEPNEENPMIGYRGTSRYLSKEFKECFKLECDALKIVRNEKGLTNVEIMVPFVRTLNEAKQVTQLLAENGLKRGENNLKVIMMCEIPANAILADKFLEYFDGFSIGSNDLTQLTLGLDRDSGLISHLFDERDLAIKTLIKMAIKACKKQNKYIGICGQAPSDYPDFAYWLLEQDIDSISLNPDSVIRTWNYLSTNK